MNYRCQTVVCTGVKEVVELDNLEDFPWHGGKSHFSYACKMRYPLNLVLENCKYLWFFKLFG